MNNEPVAWMQTWENQDGFSRRTVNIEQIGKNDIPLYTHPVKELTDEEIEEVWLDDVGLKNTNYSDIVRFARAILRKVQEK